MNEFNDAMDAKLGKDPKEKPYDRAATQWDIFATPVVISYLVLADLELVKEEEKDEDHVVLKCKATPHAIKGADRKLQGADKPYEVAWLAVRIERAGLGAQAILNAPAAQVPQQVVLRGLQNVGLVRPVGQECLYLLRAR
jgi:hypothetical protein